MRRLKHILIVFFTLFSSAVFSQKTEILDDFSIYELNGTVYISCTITQGQTCNGINVWRSDDNINFSQVGHVDGICGSSSAPVPYNFTDESPIFNRVSYYRVELGGSGFSEILSIEIIDTRLYGFQVRPNPANNKTVVYFKNKDYEQFQLILYDMYGKQQTQVVSTSNEFALNTSDLSSGYYFFVIQKVSGNADPLQGKLVVSH